MWVIIHFDPVGLRIGSEDKQDIYPDGWFVDAVYTGSNAKTDAHGALADYQESTPETEFYIGEVETLERMIKEYTK